VLDLRLVIEVHGEQHYKPVAFGGMDSEAAAEALLDQQYRDNKKMEAAEEMGWTYIVVPYFDCDKVNESYITQCYIACRKDIPIRMKKPKQLTDYQQQQKERARVHRQELYRKAKQYRDTIKQRRLKDEEEGHSD
jgi:hypothetical protein